MLGLNVAVAMHVGRVWMACVRAWLGLCFVNVSVGVFECMLALPHHAWAQRCDS